MINNSKVIVTGGAGFIGVNLVEKLIALEPAAIIVVDNLVRAYKEFYLPVLSRKAVTFVEGDIRDTGLMTELSEGADTVFHFASLSLLACEQNEKEGWDVNVNGTLSVLKAMETSRVKKIVFASSSSVYGDAIFEPITEAHPLNTQLVYGKSKIAGENLLREYHEKCGFEYVAMRFGNVYGPRQDTKGAYVAVIPRMIQNAMEKRDTTIDGDGSQYFDFIFVDDVVDAIIRAALKTGLNTTINIGSGVKTSINELAAIIAKRFGGTYHFSNAPVKENLIKKRVLSKEMSEDCLGKYCATPLSDGISKTFDYLSRSR